MKNAFAYYKSRYGPPERKSVVVTHGGERIEVCKWSARTTGEGGALYATLGAGELLGNRHEGCEFFITLSPDADDIAKALAETGADGNGTKAIPASGDTITLGYPLWRGTRAHAFLFAKGDDVLPPVSLPEKEILFIRLVPLFESELQYKNEKGEAALWRRFRQDAVAYWDSTREQAF